METLIGREKETAALSSYLTSKRAEFIAIYGRRRVGKTFLVRSFFKDNFDFYATGSIDGTMAEQIDDFNDSLKEYGFKGKKAKTWKAVFSNLASLIKEKSKVKERVIVFLDELPWFDTQHSGFKKALDYFWNSQGSWIDNLFLIVCGSATSWMIRNIIDSKGGLYNRKTHEMHIAPFTLYETERYLKSRGSSWDRLSIAQIYMAIGGIPYYLSLLNVQDTIHDNIDRLFFSRSAELQREYKRLFKSLYKDSKAHMDIVTLLAKHKSGLTRSEIVKLLGKRSGGGLTQKLEDLVYCDFIDRFNNGKSKNNSIYRVSDFYIMFYQKFCEFPTTDIHYWRNNIGTPTINTWYGLAFERLCMYHVQQIKQTLHFDTIYCEYYSWRKSKSDKNVQIDLVIDRADNIVTICEIKYSKHEYSLDEKEYKKIIKRREVFAAAHPKKGVQVVMITTFGVNLKNYPEIMSRSVVLDNLFEKLHDD